MAMPRSGTLMLRFHELVFCLTALLAPLTSLAIWPVWWVPLAAMFGVSLPLIWLTGWLIDHTYG